MPKSDTPSSASATTIPMTSSGLGGVDVDVGGMSPSSSSPASSSSQGSSSSGASSAPQGGAARDRIHQWAGALHRAIDSMEQQLSGAQGGQGTLSTLQSKYAEPARQYGTQLREQVNAKPMQSIGIALGVGMVLHKLLFRAPAPQVRVIHTRVPVPVPAWDARQAPERLLRRPLQATGSAVRGLGNVGQDAVAGVGAVAGAGLSTAKALASTLTDKASTLPLQMRIASERLLAKSQTWGSMARTGMQAHPMAGVGVALGTAALATTVLMRRRQPSTGTAYVTVDEKGNAKSWQRDGMDVRSSARNVMTQRPVASAAVVFGVGALAAALFTRRS